MYLVNALKRISQLLLLPAFMFLAACASNDAPKSASIPQASADDDLRIGEDTAKFGAEVKNSNLLRVVRGRYDYLSASDRELRGTETFLLVAQSDGTRTLTASTDIFSRNVQVNAMVRVDANFRPIESFLQTYTQGRLKGSGLYRREGTQLRELVEGTAGKVDRLVDAPDVYSIAAHPIASDSWQFWPAFAADSETIETTIYNIDGFPKWEEHMIGAWDKHLITKIGTRTITTRAGTFETRGYRLDELFEVWLTGEDNLIVEMSWPTFDRIYLLSEYSVSSRI